MLLSVPRLELLIRLSPLPSCRLPFEVASSLLVSTPWTKAYHEFGNTVVYA